MTYTIELSNVATSYQYKLKLEYVQTYRPQTEKNVTNISAPGQKPENAYLMQFQGMTMRFRLEGMLYNDGTDIADGTAPQDGTFNDTDGDGTEDVIEIMEQVKWINFYIHRQGIGVKWTVSGPGLPTGGVDCAIERASARPTADRPHEAEVSLVLVAGEVIG